MRLKLSVLLLFSIYLVDSTLALEDKHVKTLYGHNDGAGSGKKTLIINAHENNELSNHNRHKRSPVGPLVSPNDTVTTKINHLNDTHKQLMVHWVGEGSNVIICLARDPPSTVTTTTSTPAHPSAVYISYNYGDTYDNKTELFKLQNGDYATLEKFHNHPKYHTHFVFTDLRHKAIFVTTDHGKTIQRLDLDFTPSDVLFQELHPSTFVVLDKEDDAQKLYITEDFGTTFRMAQEFVKSVHWIKEAPDSQALLIQRQEPGRDSVILTSQDLFKSKKTYTIAADVKELFIKGDYIFLTAQLPGGTVNLFVYHNKVLMPCYFDSELNRRSILVVDVTGNRALVAVSHSETLSHLYVSDNLNGVDHKVKFTLSLEDVLCYFPNITWQRTWLNQLSPEAFADVYKVEGLSGIYIASRFLSKPTVNVGPQHFGSVITFDHGATWRLIEAPNRDVEGQPTSCQKENNCSLHLNQKFSQLNPETRSLTILSSKSAPGIIVATGILGRNLKGHYGVYISTDAGRTWRQALRDLYFFNMGDHGGLLTAVKYYKFEGETRHIQYSTDEGETWQRTTFHNEDVKLYGLMTEPGENTTVFTMFGSLAPVHQWLIVKVDFIKAFKRNCTKDDYKPWSPSMSEENRNYVPCILGQTLTYQRRIPHANCYNGLDFDAPTSMQPCDCDFYDYECDFGFVRTGKPGFCVRNQTVLVDPYKVPDKCPPGTFYNRTKGYRKIAGDICVGGFEAHYLPDEIPCPFDEVEDFLLFAQREKISRYNLITKTVEDVPIKNLKNVIAIDFDMKNNCVYWADIASDIIGRQCLSNGNESEILASQDLSSVEGMALDWISNNLYFVDGIRAKIELIRTDINHSGRMRRTVLNGTVLKKPRGIALHPKHGYMFWTDWSAENPSVSRANLDGSNTMQLFGKAVVEWPNGITIDYIAERIYWVDARKDYIASAGLHGDDLKYIISQEDIVSHPFAVAVFKNNMYWDDWKRNAIFMADKDTYLDKSGAVVLLKQLSGLMDLKVYAHGLQVGSNDCTGSTDCPYICTGAPKNNRHVCLCPDVMYMRDGKCMCPGDVQATENMTCPMVGNSCGPRQFRCADTGYCVPEKWKCDGENDCGDGSDEVSCQKCPINYIKCGDGKCLPHYWRCDFDLDCADGSDEKGCIHVNCTQNQFRCSNGRCISQQWKCDGENDCHDGSDERNCDPQEPSSCQDNEFHCHGGSITCIPSTWRCDGENDCRDNSDEIKCGDNTCSEVQFSCGPSSNNRCIYNTWVCDGDKDCFDGSDEKNCSSISPHPSRPDHFMPQNGTCVDWTFRCMNNRCIPYWWKCDDADDCGDGSDEVGCPTFTTTTSVPTTVTFRPPSVCMENQFQCKNGGCIHSSWVCDSTEDCPGGEDEARCEGVVNCTADQFKCRMDGSCVSLSVVCNEKFDCPDGTDELMCEHNLPNEPATPSCSVGYFPCDNNVCHPLSSMCDNKFDCIDGYDEANCTKSTRIYQIHQMGVDERSINESTILLYWWIPTPTGVKLEFLPSIAKCEENKWQNKTWTEEAEYEFDNLEPYTKYNMTVYVRVQDTKTVFPPAKYFIAFSGEGIPSEPWNVTATQKNGSHVLLQWKKPMKVNGIISNYQICWYPPLPPIKLKLSGNETAHLLAAEFEPDVTYHFYVIAFNKKYESKSSEVTTVKFDGDSDLEHVKNLTVIQTTNSTVTLTWPPSKSAEGYTVQIDVGYPYPNIPSRKTNLNNLTIDNLAPGVTYLFKVNAYKKHFIGPESRIHARTSGAPLPQVNSIQVSVVKQLGTTVKVSWERPKDPRKISWKYGIYYGIDQDQLLEKPRYETTNLTATIQNLDACEMYSFSVGITGPYGYGPLSNNFETVDTYLNSKAPPKKLYVGADGDNPLRMKVQWAPACPTDPEPVSYVISVYDMVKNVTSSIIKPNTVAENCTQVFKVSYGAIYSVRVSTNVEGSIFTPPQIYQAPNIPAPYEFNVVVENNGSYVAYWQEHDLPDLKDCVYEVFVSPGNTFNKSIAQRFTTKDHTFVYTNDTESVYSFSVRVATNDGYYSPMTGMLSKPNNTPTVITGSNLTVILVVSFLILICLSVALAVFIIKHRRLQNSFTRFANSHYDTRSGAATFDDHGLGEDDSPQITGFSDDEPLVIA